MSHKKKWEKKSKFKKLLLKLCGYSSQAIKYPSFLLFYKKRNSLYYLLCLAALFTY